MATSIYDRHILKRGFQCTYTGLSEDHGAYHAYTCTFGKQIYIRCKLYMEVPT